MQQQHFHHLSRRISFRQIFAIGCVVTNPSKLKSDSYQAKPAGLLTRLAAAEEARRPCVESSPLALMLIITFILPPYHIVPASLATPRAMSAFYSLSDDEDDNNQQPIAGPSSLLATPRRKQADSTSMLESPSASPFSRGQGAGAAANAITPPPRHHGAYNNRSSSPSAGRRPPVPVGGPTLPALASAAAAAGPSTGPPPPLPAIERLQKVWVAERCSPELMAWTDPGAKYRCDDIVDDVCAQIEQQVVSWCTRGELQEAACPSIREVVADIFLLLCTSPLPCPRARPHPPVHPQPPLL